MQLLSLNRDLGLASWVNFIAVFERHTACVLLCLCEQWLFRDHRGFPLLLGQHISWQYQ